jgi:heptosyltransferase-2
MLGVVDLFVSNDMGLAHIAAALGTPTLTIFGPTNETATSPLGPNARFIRDVVECSPCMLRECPIDHRCMVRLAPERVFDVASGMLKSRITQDDTNQP